MLDEEETSKPRLLSVCVTEAKANQEPQSRPVCARPATSHLDQVPDELLFFCWSTAQPSHLNVIIITFENSLYLLTASL